MLSAQENSRHAHKIDYLVYWTDNEKRNWEMVAGEFCGRPFEPDRKKYRKDLFKLFRIMKDMLDCLIAQIISCSNGKINEEIYDLICQIKTFGIISYGIFFCNWLFKRFVANTKIYLQLETQIELFVLSRPFPSIHTVTRWCTLPLPYKKSDHEALLPIIESLWGLLQVPHIFLFLIFDLLFIYLSFFYIAWSLQPNKGFDQNNMPIRRKFWFILLSKTT